MRYHNSQYPFWYADAYVLREKYGIVGAMVGGLAGAFWVCCMGADDMCVNTVDFAVKPSSNRMLLEDFHCS